MCRSLLLIILLFACNLRAQHTRLYAVVAGNDDPANFMAGSSLGSGLWQSDDTGRTWKQLGWKHIKAFSMDHDSNGRVLYLAAGNGVLKSTDFGETWKVMTDWRVTEVMDILVIRSRPNIVLAATAHGIIKSTDGGVNWETSHNGIPVPYSSRLHLSGEVVYACTEDGLYCSKDLGSIWTRIAGSPNAIRAATAYMDQTYIVGDSHFALVGYDGHMSEPGRSITPLWDVHYSSGLSRLVFGGMNGVGMFRGGSPRLAFSGPSNAHSVISIGEMIFAGTLGDGVWIQEQPLGEWQQTGLAKSQIWTLKIAHVE